MSKGLPTLVTDISYAWVQYLFYLEKPYPSPLSVLNALRLDEKHPMAIYWDEEMTPALYLKEVRSKGISSGFGRTMMEMLRESRQDRTVAILSRKSFAEIKSDLTIIRVVFGDVLRVEIRSDTHSSTKAQLQLEVSALLGSIGVEPPVMGKARGFFDVYGESVDMWLPDTLRDAITTGMFDETIKSLAEQFSEEEKEEEEKEEEEREEEANLYERSALSNMKMAELRLILKKLGRKTRGRKKSDYVNAILAKERSAKTFEKVAKEKTKLYEKSVLSGMNMSRLRRILKKLDGKAEGRKKSDYLVAVLAAQENKKKEEEEQEEEQEEEKEEEQEEEQERWDYEAPPVVHSLFSREEEKLAGEKDRDLIHALMGPIGQPNLRQTAHISLELFENDEGTAKGFRTLEDSPNTIDFGEEVEMGVGEGTYRMRFELENLEGIRNFENLYSTIAVILAFHLEELHTPLAALYAAILKPMKPEKRRERKEQGRFDGLREVCGETAFPLNFASRCSPPSRQPVVVFTKAEKEGMEKKTINGPDGVIARPSMQIECSEKPAWVFCPVDTHPFPARTPGGAICCRESIVKKRDGPKKTSSYNIVGRKIIGDEGRISKTDRTLLKVLRYKGGTRLGSSTLGKDELVRMGVERGTGAFLRAAEIALLTDGARKMKKPKKETEESRRSRLKASVSSVSLLRQEDQETPAAELLAELGDHKKWLDPRKHIRAVEEHLGVNIVLVTWSGQKLDFLLPFHEGPYYSAWRKEKTILILCHSENGDVDQRSNEVVKGGQGAQTAFSHCEALAVKQDGVLYTDFGSVSSEEPKSGERSGASVIAALLWQKQGRQPPPTPNYVPAVGDVQILDGYGKLRGFLRRIQGEDTLHVFAVPMAPFDWEGIFIGSETVLSYKEWDRGAKHEFPGRIVSETVSFIQYEIEPVGGRVGPGLLVYIPAAANPILQPDPPIAILAPNGPDPMASMHEKERATLIVLHIFMFAFVSFVRAKTKKKLFRPAATDLDSFFSRFVVEKGLAYDFKQLRGIPEAFSVGDTPGSVDKLLVDLEALRAPVLSGLVGREGGRLKFFIPRSISGDVRYFLSRLHDYAGEIRGQRIEGYFRTPSDFDDLDIFRIKMGRKSSLEPVRFRVGSYDARTQQPQFVSYLGATFLLQRVQGVGKLGREGAETLIGSWHHRRMNLGFNAPRNALRAPEDIYLIEVQTLAADSRSLVGEKPRKYYVLADGSKYSAMIRLD